MILISRRRTDMFSKFYSNTKCHKAKILSTEVVFVMEAMVLSKDAPYTINFLMFENETSKFNCRLSIVDKHEN